MKIVSIGDTHGIDILPEINIVNYDKIIFVGDYMDSFTVSGPTQIDNLLKIIELKLTYPEKVELLLGNHDIQYYLHDSLLYLVRASGYNPITKFDAYDVFTKHKDLFKIAWQYDNYIWTHAGIHKGWYNDTFKRFDIHKTLADSLNFELEEQNPVLWWCSLQRGGSHKTPGPLWADKIETWRKPLPGFHQIVGHTHLSEIKQNILNTDTSVTYIDTINDSNSNRFYTINL